jgi:hypothetical protein
VIFPFGDFSSEIIMAKLPGPERVWYVLIQDDDCHWYVCPAGKQEEAAAYFEAVEQHADGPDESLALPEEPVWLERVGGAPSLVKFTDYIVG